MEIEVGEYIRTRNGDIGKVLIFYGKDECYKKMNNYSIDAIDGAVYEEDIKAHSKNIIDLIEKEDYVNGCKVYEVRKDEIVVYLERQPINCYNYIMADEIKSIVTKEQIKQIEYKIKE